MKILYLSKREFNENCNLTFFVTIDFPDCNLSRPVLKLLVDFVSRLVPNWRQHVTEPAPVSIEVDEDHLVVLQGVINVGRVKHDRPAVDGVVKQVQQLEKKNPG